MRYDLTDLKLFINIGETANLTRAAEKTFLSLPAASARIKNLEESLKVRLLIRQVTGVRMTPAGEILLKYAKGVFQQLECLHSDLQPFSTGIKGKLRILANMTATHSFLAEALSSFLLENPDIDIELEEKLTKDIISAVRAGSADLGIASGSSNLDGLDVVPLFKDELVVVTDLEHELSNRHEIKFEELIENYHFVGIDPASVIQSFLEEKAYKLGKRIRQRVYVGSFETVCRMVDAKIGLAIVPIECARNYSKPERLHIVRISDDWANRERFICRLGGRDLPAFAEKFIEHVIRIAGNINDTK
ncbi:MAG: LysR family transcriptional regulator [Alcaligenaceae bacterium]|nr:LysR family transcriptional regulator [Alcaligenaceae bacterium]